MVQKYTKNMTKSSQVQKDSNISTNDLGRNFTDTPIDISSDEESGTIVIEGVIFDLDIRETKREIHIYSVYNRLYKFIIAKLFSSKERSEYLFKNFK